MTAETVPVYRRIYLTLEPGGAGKVVLKLSQLPPAVGAAVAALISKGVLMHGSTEMAVQLVTEVSPALTPLGEVTLTETATVAISAGPRTLTLTGIAGLKKGDAVLLLPSAQLPAGYVVTSAVAVADGKLVVTLIVPLLAIGAKYALPCRLVRLNI